MGNPLDGEAMRSRVRLKQEIVATMITDIRKKASETGSENYIALADSMFPDVPESLRIEAWMALDDEDEEAWWQTVERTIDGEVIRNAIQQKGSAA